MRSFGLTGSAAVMSVVLAGVLLAPLTDAGAQIRCWTNASGSRECSDLPPPSNAKGVSEIRGRASRIEGQESFAQRQATERFPVTLWSSDCGDPCTNARKLLTSRGVPFTDRNPAQPTQQEEFKRLTKGQMQVPLLVVGTSQLNGFEEGQWNTTLDAAGYSRTPTRPAARPAPDTASGGARPGIQPGGRPGAAVPGNGGSPPVQTGPGGTVIPPPDPAQSSPGYAPLPPTSGGPGETSTPAGPVSGTGLR